MEHQIKIFFIAFLLNAHFSFGQSMFQKLIVPPTPFSTEGIINDICDNGYNRFVVIGNMRNVAASPTDVLISSFDQYGNMLWSRTFGNQILETGNAIQLLPDNNFIALGTTGYSDILLIKIDNFGNEIWAKSFGTAGSEFGYSIDNTIDNGFILTGEVISSGDRNIYLIKADSAGNIQWAKTYGDTLFQATYCVQECINGDFIVSGMAGNFVPNTNYDNLLIRTDNQGNIKWAKTYGEIYHGEGGYSLTETVDGGIIVVGATTSAYGNAIVLKTDSLGNVEWYNSYGGYFNPGVGGEDVGKQIIQNADGSYFFTGTYVNFPYTFDKSVLLVKLDVMGNILWSKYYNTSTDIRGNCLYKLNNNALGIGGMGYANNSMNPFLIKADLNGNSGCYDSVPNISIQLPFNYVVNNIILPTDTITLNVSNYNLIQTDFGMDSTVCLTTGYNINEGNLLKVKLFPNPFTNSTILDVDQFLNNATIELYNVTGFIVKKLCKYPRNPDNLKVEKKSLILNCRYEKKQIHRNTNYRHAQGA